jgi:hypothetical protein
MARFVDCKFLESTVVLDGNEYLRCEFIQARIVVTRGNFSLRECKFDGCHFEFGGEAANIKELLMGLLKSQQPQNPGSAGAATNG